MFPNLLYFKDTIWANRRWDVYNDAETVGYRGHGDPAKSHPVDGKRCDSHLTVRGVMRMFDRDAVMTQTWTCGGA